MLPIAKVPVSEQKDFEICPEGTHFARIYSIIDLGTQQGEYQGNPTIARKFKVDFETPTKKAIFNADKGEQPFSLSDNINFKITTEKSATKAKLNKVIEACGMKPVKDFNIFDLMGKTCMITVGTYVANNGNKYANITNYSSVAEDLIDVKDKKFAPINKTKALYLDPEYFDEKVFESLPKFVKEKIEVTSEYAYCTKGLPSGLTVQTKNNKPKKEVVEEEDEENEIDVDKLGIQMPF